MRTKSEAKRQAILEVAAQVFRELGFERASMSAIRARVGGSKATIYNYFASKEALFTEVMFRSNEAELEATRSALDSETEDVAAALRHFGERLLALLYSPEVLAVRRLIVAESGRSELGRLCYDRGPKRGQALIVDFLQRAMAAGQLRPADPQVAGMHLRALLEAELIEGFLFQTTATVDGATIQAVVGRAVAAFMAAYGPASVLKAQCLDPKPEGR